MLPGDTTQLPFPSLLGFPSSGIVLTNTKHRRLLSDSRQVTSEAQRPSNKWPHCFQTSILYASAQWKQKSCLMEKVCQTLLLEVGRGVKFYCIIFRTPNWWKCEHPMFTISFDTRYALAILKHAIEDDWFLLTLPVLFRSGSLDLVPFTQVQRHRVPRKVTITWSSCGCATFPSCYDQTSKTAKQWPNIQLLARGQ